MVRTSFKKIPIEILSDEGVYTEAATPSNHTPTSASKLNRNAKSIDSVSVKAKRRLCMTAEPDIEDYGDFLRRKKKPKADKNTLLHRLGAREACLSLMSPRQNGVKGKWSFLFSLKSGRTNEAKQMYFGEGRWNNEAIKAGRDRHVQLEQEVHTSVELKVESREDEMALKLVNFINGVNQLLFDGLTRELPIASFAFAQGMWMVGKIDEVQMPRAKKDHNPTLVETKTRFQDTVPSEAQKRN